MERKTVKIRSIENLNHNVLRIVTEKPANYSFVAGQATDVAINKENWKDEKRPFTFTNLPSDDYLQFVIKVYPSHDGVTEQLAKLKKGDELIVGEVYGAIRYEGKGIFLAGGAGVTPFIAILNALDKQKELNGNSLIFANKTKKDIFLQEKFESLLGRHYINILSKEKTKDHPHGHIDKAFLNNTVTDLSQYFYVCGPPKMIEAVTNDLRALGVKKEQIITEDFED